MIYIQPILDLKRSQNKTETYNLINLDSQQIRTIHYALENLANDRRKTQNNVDNQINTAEWVTSIIETQAQHYQIKLNTLNK